MCPLRFWLLFFSGIVAGYLAWTSAFFSGGDGARLVGDDSVVKEGVEGESPEECGGGGVGGGAKAKNKASKKSWKDWGMFAVDGLSGRYLYNVMRGGEAAAGSCGGGGAGGVGDGDAKKSKSLPQQRHQRKKSAGTKEK